MASFFRFLLIAEIFSLISYHSFSQNIQLHYDLGEDRKLFTSTVELFKKDSLGNTFFFIDFDYGGKGADVEGVSNAYWEITREFTIPTTKLAFHAEYNAGMFRNHAIASEINNALLLGTSYLFHSNDYTKTLTIQTLYKAIQNRNPLSFQITAVWGMHFLRKKFSINGFADFWREDVILFNDEGTGIARFVFLSETQFWYNLNNSFSLGSEIELSNNFSAHEGFMINPTLAIKWTL